MLMMVETVTVLLQLHVLYLAFSSKRKFCVYALVTVCTWRSGPLSAALWTFTLSIVTLITVGKGGTQHFSVLENELPAFTRF